MRRTLRGRTPLVPVLVASIVALAACGSSGDDDAAASGSSASAGSSKPALTGEKLTLGFGDPGLGAAAYPEVAAAGKAAIWYVNNVLGGIKGRPLDLIDCQTDGAPETAIPCANKFVAANVPAVVDGYDAGMGAEYPILKSAQIPIIGTVAGNSVTDVAPIGTAFYFVGPQASTAVGFLQAFKEQGLKTAALALTDAQASRSYVDRTLAPLAKKLGIDFSPIYVSGTTANFVTVAATEISTKADVVGSVAMSEGNCAKLVDALKQQKSTKTLYMGTCTEFVDTSTSGGAGAIIGARNWLPQTAAYAPDTIKKQLKDAEDAFAQTGNPGKLAPKSMYAFSAIVTTAQVLATMTGEITNTTVTETMKNLKDFQVFAGPLATCDGSQWPGTSSCTKQAILLKVQDDKSLKPLDPSGYATLDVS